MNDVWKIALGVVLALILIPFALKLFGLVVGLALGIAQLAIAALVVVFVIGLCRRLLTRV